MSNGAVYLRSMTEFASDFKIDSLIHSLAPDEQARAATYRVESARTAFIIRRAWLRSILAVWLDLRPDTLQFALGGQGKPYLANIALQFSLSHSGDWMLCAISPDAPVGADIEVIRDLSGDPNWIMTTAKSMFAPDECAALEACPTHEARRDLFFAYWTIKEAVVKTVGLGLTADTQRFCAAIDSSQSARIGWSEIDAIPVSGWQIMHRNNHTEGYVYAIAHHRLRSAK